MRKIVFFILLMIFVVNPINHIVFAASNNTVQYKIPDLNMKINVPEGYIVLTQDVDKTGIAPGYINIDKDELAKSMRDKGIYFNVVSRDLQYEIVVRMFENSNTHQIKDFKDLEYVDLVKAKSLLLDDKLNQTVSIYDTSQAKFLKTQFDKKTGSYSVQNYTIVNGQCINIELISYTLEPTNLQLSVLDDMIKSIKFTRYPEFLDNIESKDTIFSIMRYGIPILAVIVVSLIVFLILRRRKGQKSHKVILFKKEPKYEFDKQSGDNKNTGNSVEPENKVLPEQKQYVEYNQNELSDYNIDNTKINSVEEDDIAQLQDLFPPKLNFLSREEKHETNSKPTEVINKNVNMNSNIHIYDLDDDK